MYGVILLLVVAMLTGQVWAKPGVDFIMRMLSESIAREAKLAEALGENTAVMRELVAELRVSRRSTPPP